MTCGRAGRAAGESLGLPGSEHSGDRTMGGKQDRNEAYGESEGEAVV